MRKPSLSTEVKSRIKSEYSLGAGINDLARKYNRGNSTISRLCKGLPRDNEKLATDLATVSQAIGTRPLDIQDLILKRSWEIEQVLDTAIRGTKYIQSRIMQKLEGTKDDDLAYRDLATAQDVMTKAHAIAVPKVDTQVNVNNITGIKLIS